MARIVYSGLVTEIKGSIGGSTFQKNRSGYIVRNKQYKGPVRTSANVETGRSFGIASRRWQSLTAAQRTDYNTMASTYNYVDLWGNSKTLTGFQWFMASTGHQYLIDGVGLPIAAVGSPVIVPPTFNFYLSSSVFYLNDFEWSGSNADCFIVYATPPLRSTALINRLNYRIIRVLNYTGPGPANLDSWYLNVFNLTRFQLVTDCKGVVSILVVFFKNNIAGHSTFVVKQVSL